MYADFPQSLLEQMESEDLLLHAHNWVVKTDLYKERPQVADFFEILATDEHEGEEFVIAAQGRKYPMYAIMHHPETQNSRSFN